MSNEKYLKDHICPHCHAGIMEQFQDYVRAANGWIKCGICGFCKQLVKTTTTETPKEKIQPIDYNRKL